MDNLKRFVKSYAIIPTIIFSLLILIAVPFLSDYVLTYLKEIIGIRINGNTKNTVIMVMYVIGYAILLYFFYLNAQRVKYKKETGRSLAKDRRETGQDVSTLGMEYRKEDADPYRLDLSLIPAIEWAKYHGVAIGYDSIEKKIIGCTCDGDGVNCLCVAPPGAGKTRYIVGPTAARFGGPKGENGSTIVIDMKGDVFHLVSLLAPERKIAIFDPDHPEQSYHFDPLYPIRGKEWETIEDYIETLSTIIIPDENSENSASAYFVEGARDFFMAVSFFLINSQNSVSFIEIIDNILHHSYTEWIALAKNTGFTPMLDILASYDDNNPKNVSGCYQKLCTALRKYKKGGLKTVLAPGDRMITPELIDEKHFDIYIEISQRHLKKFSSIVSMLTFSFIDYFMDRPDLSSKEGKNMREVCFLLDETIQIPLPFDILESAMSTLRSKKVSIVIVAQSLAQFEAKLGEARTRVLVDNCRYIAVMGAQDPKSRQFFSDLFGQHRVLVKSDTQSKDTSSKTISRKMEPIYRPEDFSNLKRRGKNGKVLIFYDGLYVEADKMPVDRILNNQKKKSKKAS